MKMLIIHLPWTLCPYACTAEVVLVQTWKNASLTKQSGQKNCTNYDKWLARHDVLVRGYGNRGEKVTLTLAYTLPTLLCVNYVLCYVA
jgi:hypothetical protein